MPRTPQQNAIIRDKRRTKILLKTLKLFATKGFDEVTIDAISIESACSHGLVYHYFEKKEDIFNGLFELQREDYNETIFPRNAALQAGGLGGLKVICDYYEKFYGADKIRLYFLKTNASRDYTTYTSVKTLNGESPFKTLVTLLKQAIEAGEILECDVEAKARLFLDLVTGTLTRLISAKEKEREIKSGALYEFIRK